MNKSMSLFLLQNIDQKIDQIHAHQNKIDLFLADHTAEELASAREESARADRAVTEKELDALEKKIQTSRIKLQQSESSLYGGKIQSPKELQDLEAEIKLLKSSIAQFETRQFDLMLEIEKEQSHEAGLHQVTSEAASSHDQQAIDLLTEKSDLAKSLDKNLTERKALSAGIDADILEIYERLRSTKSGIAITGVDDGTCSACGAEITLAEWQRARISSELCYCGTCGRILYGK
jgi:uncharacterized protein